MGYLNSIYATGLPSRAVNVYRYLRDRTNDEGQCYPSMDRIASDLHISERTVNRAIKELVEAGFIEKKNRFRTYDKKTYGKTSNLYTVHKFD